MGDWRTMLRLAAFRLLVVSALLITMFRLLQGALTRDEASPAVFRAEAEGRTRDGQAFAWVFVVKSNDGMTLDGRPATFDSFLARLVAMIGGDGVLRCRATPDGAPAVACTVKTAGADSFRLDDQPCSLTDVEKQLRTLAGVDALVPTRPATIREILAANIPAPTRSKVSLPRFSYKQAFPEATDAPELVIRDYGEAPDLKKRAALAKTDPLWLPPVAERLPENPAVVAGPDGIGRYGGVWRQCAASSWHLGTKVAYESFVRFDPSGRLQPCAAYKWEVSDDCRVFTFYLRKGHRWSDGHPFTAHDIAWVCNVNIGSAHWPEPADWMQATDGTLLLYPEDILNWTGFAARIRREGGADTPSIGKQLWILADEKLRGDLSAIDAARQPDEAARIRIVAAVNKILRDPKFFRQEACAAIDLRSEPDALRVRGASRLTPEETERLNLLQWRADLWARQTDPAVASREGEMAPNEIGRLNLWLFRAAYAGLVDKAKKTRVQVECVPDAAGDDSHILRFTFRKPNSFFLEKTATFMFYRGLFTMPPHVNKKFHLQGSDRLEAVDLLDAKALASRLTAAREGAAGRRNERLWNCLAPEARARTESLAKGDAPADTDRERLAADINAALEKSEYYDDAAWRDLEFAKEFQDLEATGYSKLGRDRRFRWNELQSRADALARVRKDGVGSLSPAERYRFQLAMFRAAYAPDLVGTNREESLNRAARAGTPSYDTWVIKLRSLGQYHPLYNPDYPTLAAWRVVTEPSQRVVRAVRNPYYYKVDAAGNQLPYLDEIACEIEAQSSVRMLKFRSGNVDFQTRDIDFADFTVLKQNEKAGGYEIRLWANDYCGELTFYCLQARKDPLYRKLQDDPRFRRALSLALNRREMIDVIWKGMGTPAQFSVPEGSPYYNEREARMCVEHDPAAANRLLDAMGLDKRAVDGTRLFWDGKTPVILTVSATQDRPLTAVQMACNYWQAVGLNAQMKVVSGSQINRMIELGTLDIGVHKEGGNFFGPVLAGSYAPTHPAECPQWGTWVTWLTNGGMSGEEPPDRLKEIALLWDKVGAAPNEKEKLAAWRRLADRTADDLPWIAVSTSPGQPVYVKNGFKNVPRLSLSGWIAHQPGNCCPEVFFKAEGAD